VEIPHAQAFICGQICFSSRSMRKSKTEYWLQVNADERR